MAGAQVYGMAMNGLGFAWLAFVAAFAEYLVRQLPLPPLGLRWPLASSWSLSRLPQCPFAVPLMHGRTSIFRHLSDKVVAGLFVALARLLAWHGLGFLHHCAARTPLAHPACRHSAARLGRAGARGPFADGRQVRAARTCRHRRPAAVPRHRTCGVPTDRHRGASGIVIADRRHRCGPAAVLAPVRHQLHGAAPPLQEKARRGLSGPARSAKADAPLRQDVSCQAHRLQSAGARALSSRQLRAQRPGIAATRGCKAA